MSKSWKCALCGAVVISKCPSQRSIFPAFKEGIIDSLLSVQRVDDVKGNTAEVFLNFTGTKKDSTGQIVKSMIGLISDPPEYLDNLGCEHIWVLNSETETECSLGCTHANLNDIERIKSKTASSTVKRTCTDLLQEYSYVVTSVLEQARKAVNMSKTSFDPAAENDFAHLKSQVREGLRKLGKCEPAQKLFRVRKTGATWRDRDSYVYFDTLDDAKQFALGVRLMTATASVEIEALDTKHECYMLVTEYIDYSYTCCICGESVDDTFILLPDCTAAHQKCYKVAIDRPKKLRRSGVLTLTKSVDWHIEDELKEVFKLKTCQYAHKRNEQFGYVRFSVVCTGEEFEALCERMLYYLS